MKAPVAKRAITIEDLLAFKLVGGPQLDPAGTKILFSLKTVNDKNKAITQLLTVDLTGHVTELTHGEKSSSSAKWSPDGKSVLFQREHQNGITQFFILPEHGEAHPISNLSEGSIGGAKFSPNGTKIAFTFREAHPDFSKAGVEERTKKGLSEAPKVINNVWYRLDGDGYFNDQRYHLYILDIETRQHKLLYSGDASGQMEFDWHPSSKEIIVCHSANLNRVLEKPNDQLYRVKLTGESSMLEGLPRGDKSNPIWSPDGTQIAYAGDTDESDPWGTRNTKLYVVSAEGGRPKDLTGHQDYDFVVATLSDTKEAAYEANFHWTEDGKHLIAEVGWHGANQIVRVDAISTGVSFVTQGNHFVGLGNISKNARFASAVYGHPGRVPEIAVVTLDEDPFVEVLTHFNDPWQETVEIPMPEEIWIDSTDDTKVHGWVLKPVGFDPTAKYPAVLEVHGGPHTQYGWTFFHEFQVLASNGYVVVYTNPRGSKGYGESFCNAIQGDWGNKDWDDIKAALEWMKAQPFLDSSKLGILGGSYGGYMTNWAIGHTHDFKAAITDRCVSNMVSMAGNSDFPFNKDGYFKGVAWGSLDDIKELWRQSPIAYFTGVVTPTLVIHSEGDLRCNVEQSEQVFTALQSQGVESRFVRYPKSTFHGMSRNGPADLRIHRLGEIVAWWKKFLS